MVLRVRIVARRHRHRRAVFQFDAVKIRVVGDGATAVPEYPATVTVTFAASRLSRATV